MKRMFLSLVWSLGGLYLVLCAALYLLQSRMLYLGQYTRVEAAETDFELKREGLVLRGWRINPGKPRALLYFGGNAESVQLQRADFARWFPDYTIYLLAYRGYGASDGAPGERVLKADALALFDDLQPHYGQIAALGRSVGTGVALHLAARRPIARLALITPYDSLREVAAAHYPIFPVRLLLRDTFEALADAAALQIPVLLLIAREDQVIPPRHAQRLLAAFIRTPITQWLDTDHNTVEQDARFALALRQFFAGLHEHQSSFKLR